MPQTRAEFSLDLLMLFPELLLPQQSPGQGEAVLALWSSPELAWTGSQAASVPCPCCHVPGRGSGSLAAAELCCPSAEQATLALAVPHLLLLSGWHGAPADALLLPLGWHCLPGASRTLRACLRGPLISLKLPRGCEKCYCVREQQHPCGLSPARDLCRWRGRSHILVATELLEP